MKNKNKKYKIGLSDFGNTIKKGLAKRTLSFIGKEVTEKEFEKILLELGTSLRGTLILKPIGNKK